MRRFVVNVNGNRYEVDVEEVGAFAQAAPAVNAASFPAAAPKTAEPPVVSAAPASARQDEPAPASQAAHSGAKGAFQITAPMPGTILDIRVNVGDFVTKGTVIAILEAMKMENEILAPQDAIIASINVSRNQQVNSGDIIITYN